MQDKERREVRAYRRLGKWDAACVVCGESNPHCLERHHMAGRKYLPDTATTCKNCHAKLTNEQLDHPNPAAKSEPVQLELIGRLLLGLADLFELLVGRLREYGKFLMEAASNYSRPYGR